MKKIFKILFLGMFVLFSVQSCKEEDNLETTDVASSDFISFEETKSVGILSDIETTSSTVDVYSSINLINDTNIDITFIEEESTITEEEFTFENQVTIPAGENKASVGLDIDNTAIGKTIVLQIDETDGFFIGGNGKIVITVNETCAEGSSKLDITIVFDDYSEETVYRIFDSSGNILLQNSYPASTVDDISTICLPAGEYIFALYDTYGDGMNGSFNLAVNGEIVIEENGADFGGFGVTDPVQIPFTIE
jgi:hypothetical protein